MHRFLNALGFQLGWWACVAGVGHGLEIPALMFCSALVIAHLCYTENPAQDIKLALWAVGLGIAIDSALQYFSVIDFYGWSLGALSPFWVWMLWLLFAMTINTSLSFLKEKPMVLSALAGLVFGPLTYMAGAKLGAAAFDGSALHTLTLAVTWMLALPAMVFIAKQLHRPRQP